MTVSGWRTHLPSRSYGWDQEGEFAGRVPSSTVLVKCDHRPLTAGESPTQRWPGAPRSHLGRALVSSLHLERGCEGYNALAYN